MTYEQIRYEQRDDVALLTLNRPERLNAWTPRMSRELTDAIGTANDERSIGAIVMTGEGRGFCAGADVEQSFKEGLDRADRNAAGDSESDGGADRSSPDGDSDEDRPDWVQFCRAAKPLVAAINGPAIGVGLTMILPFDHLVAARSARLSCRFVKMGLTPELASSHFLTSRMGWGAASDLALSGRIVDAPEAMSLGLVDAVVDDDALLDAAITKAREFGANPDPQLRMIKELLTINAVETDLAEVQRRELETLQAAFATPEHREAVDAFLAKRAPTFR